MEYRNFDLRKLQLIQLSMLKDVADYCDSHKIDYYLSDGTLLGAVRHQGFIPWDDDIDICMTTQSYIKFLYMIKKDPLPEKYFVQNFDSDRKFCFNWTQIRLNGTVSTYRYSPDFCAHKGIDIDVFVLRDVPINRISCIIQSFSDKLEIFLCNKWRFLSRNKKMSLIKVIFYKILPENIRIAIINRIRKNNLKIKKNTRNYYNTYYSDPTNKKHICPKKCYEERIKLKFEDSDFWAPKEYDMILTIEYGDWRTFPPTIEREGHGDIIIDFGKY